MSPKTVALERSKNLCLHLNTPKGTRLMRTLDSGLTWLIGRGVFASADIAAGTVIDVCPVLVLGLDENRAYIRHTTLYHYTYNWPIRDKAGKPCTGQAVIFGLGSMMNHSRANQNVIWERDVERGVITYKAAQFIARGEELCISYGSRLTFHDVDEARDDSDEGDGSEFLRGFISDT